MSPSHFSAAFYRKNLEPVKKLLPSNNCYTVMLWASRSGRIMKIFAFTRKLPRHGHSCFKCLGPIHHSSDLTSLLYWKKNMGFLAKKPPSLLINGKFLHFRSFTCFCLNIFVFMECVLLSLVCEVSISFFHREISLEKTQSVSFYCLFWHVF